jgi:outer membrane murein-binding lipoprotein Lpp
MEEEKKIDRAEKEGRNNFTFEGSVTAGSIGQTGGITNATINQISDVDSEAIQKLFKELYQAIELTPAKTEAEQLAKGDAQKAAKRLETEAKEVAKDKSKKFDKFSMPGFFKAFKTLGLPVFKAAMAMFNIPTFANAAGDLAKDLKEIEKADKDR